LRSFVLFFFSVKYKKRGLLFFSLYFFWLTTPRLSFEGSITTRSASFLSLWLRLGRSLLNFAFSSFLLFLSFEFITPVLTGIVILLSERSLDGIITNFSNSSIPSASGGSRTVEEDKFVVLLETFDEILGKFDGPDEEGDTSLATTTSAVHLMSVSFLISGVEVDDEVGEGDVDLAGEFGEVVGGDEETLDETFLSGASTLLEFFELLHAVLFVVLTVNEGGIDVTEDSLGGGSTLFHLLDTVVRNEEHGLNGLEALDERQKFLILFSVCSTSVDDEVADLGRLNEAEGLSDSEEGSGREFQRSAAVLEVTSDEVVDRLEVVLEFVRSILVAGFTALLAFHTDDVLDGLDGGLDVFLGTANGEGDVFFEGGDVLDTFVGGVVLTVNSTDGTSP
jgi:hypothetical protein